jgi:hypothetical protein
MKNSTLGRKASNTMKKNEGMVKPVPGASQRGDGADFAFNGQMGDGVNRMGSRQDMCVNPLAHMVENPDQINHGLIESNRRGNASDSSYDRMESVGPSVTRDPNRLTVATAAGPHPITTHDRRASFANPDAIYVTKAER